MHLLLLNYGCLHDTLSAEEPCLTWQKPSKSLPSEVATSVCWEVSSLYPRTVIVCSLARCSTQTSTSTSQTTQTQEAAFQHTGAPGSPNRRHGHGSAQTKLDRFHSKLIARKSFKIYKNSKRYFDRLLMSKSQWVKYHQHFILCIIC